jgi:hypothetical protein
MIQTSLSPHAARSLFSSLITDWSRPNGATTRSPKSHTEIILVIIRRLKDGAVDHMN